MPDDVAIAAECYIASAPLPNTGYAAIAVLAERSLTDITVVGSLLKSLKARQDSQNLVVVINAQSNITERDAELIVKLRNQGEFVIVDNLAKGIHFYDFLFSTVLISPASRLIEVDFVDIILL